MSASRVLSAAAALREFDLEQVAAFCDEPPEVIAAVLADASSCVRPVGEAGDRWRVVDPPLLRRLSRALGPSEQPSSSPEHPRPTDEVTQTRLRYAEETLLDWDDQRPYEERRLRLMAATSALRQAAADLSFTPQVWWKLQITPGGLDPHNPDLDPTTLTRLQVTEAVAYLTGQDLTGSGPDTHDLVASTKRLLVHAHDVDLRSMSDLVNRFVDLVLSLVAPPPTSAAPQRLVATIALRRVREVARRSLVAGLDELIPVVERVRGDGERTPGILQELGELPSGRTHVVVYTELLELLPRHFEYQEEGSCLLGTLTEAVTEPDTTHQLRRHAAWLARDLTQLPYGSGNALIGSATNALQQIAEMGAPDDSSLMTRFNARHEELMQLAKVPVR